MAGTFSFGDGEVAEESADTQGLSRSARLGVLTLLFSLALLAVVSAPASAGWSEPVNLSAKTPPFTFGEGPAIAVRPEGSFISAWLHSLPGSTSVGVIEGRTISATGETGPLLKISPRGNVRHPHVTVAADGAALVTWARVVAPQQIALEGRWISAAGELGRKFTLSGADGRVLATSIAIDSSGKATVGWVNQVFDSSTLRVRQVGADGTLGAEQTLTKTIEGKVTEVAIAIGPDKRPFVVYDQFGRVKFQRLGLDGTSEGVVTQISDQAHTSANLKAQADAQGKVRVLWGLLDPVPQQVFTRTIAADGTLAPTQTVAELRSASPSMALGTDGSAAITWQDTPLEREDPETVFGATILADGGFGAKLPLSDPSPTGGLDPNVSVDAQGVATAVWQRDVGGNGIVEAARFSAAGAESRVTELSIPSNLVPAPNVATAPDGPAIATWWQGGPDETTVQAKAAVFTPNDVGTNPIPVPPDPLSPPPEAPEKCRGKPATIVGTSYADEIVGSKRDDVIVGDLNGDEIRGRGGDDLICGDAGSDTLRGGAGKDKLVGGPGKDLRMQG